MAIKCSLLKRSLLIISIVLLIIIIGFAVWAQPASQKAQGVALQALTGNTAVNVEEVRDNGITRYEFTPSGVSTTGFIIYPGARVDYQAYAPVALGIAEQGYPVFLVRMPLNMAFFGMNYAEKIQRANPEIDTWAICGHSLGGVAASSYVADNPDTIDGLVLWASYPAGSTDLTAYRGQVSSIYGTLDGLSSLEEITASMTLLPASTQWVAIEGGNHAQFGDYGEQSGDMPATISQEAQHQAIITATVALLDAIRQNN